MNTDQIKIDREIQSFRGRMVSTMSLGSGISLQRASGNTTRLVDAAIQALFDGKEVLCEDHYKSKLVKVDERLRDLVVKRLCLEHRLDPANDFIIRNSHPIYTVKLSREFLQRQTIFWEQMQNPYHVYWFDKSKILRQRPVQAPPVKPGFFKRVWLAILNKA